MPPLNSRRDPTALSTIILLLIALACLVLSTSVLTATLAAAPPTPPTEASPGPGFTFPGLDEIRTADHPEKGAPYTAQGLTSARWEVGAVQANWNHRALWETPVTGSGTRVAIIDTGVDADHPDLQGSIVAWRDFVNEAPRPYDDTGHGTHVAGIIAAGGHTQLRPDQGYFLTGARGIAPDVEILAAKAMDKEGRGDPDRIAQAIEWAIDPDGEPSAHIINLSLGISQPSSGDGAGSQLEREVFPEPRSMKKVREAIEKATAQGVVVVVAAGNHEPGEESHILFPGTMDNVLTVGAVDPSGRVATFSNTGSPTQNKPDLVAPGVVVSTSPLTEDDRQIARYRGLGGTSMAAPFVTGTIALMMEADPTLRGAPGSDPPGSNTNRIRAILKDTAEPHPDHDPTEQGAGLLRVDRALQATGTGETQLRPSLYATPGLLVVGGTWIVYHRRQRATGPRRRRTGAIDGGPTPHGDHSPRPRPVFQEDHPLPLESLHAPPSPRSQPRRTSGPIAPAPRAPVRPAGHPVMFTGHRGPTTTPHPRPGHTSGRARPSRPQDPTFQRSAARRPMRRRTHGGPTGRHPVPHGSLKHRSKPRPAAGDAHARTGPHRAWRELNWD